MASAEPDPAAGPALPSHPLVWLARQAVESYVLRGEVVAPDRPLAPPDATVVLSSTEALPERAGCFVSIKTLSGVLRGCIGSVEPIEPTLPREVVRNAIHSATRDPRFLPVTSDELSDLVFSVDVLWPPELVEGLDQLDPTRYGVIVQRGARRGLLLPDIEGVVSAELQVAIARSKAFIAPDEPVQLWRFQVIRLR